MIPTVLAARSDEEWPTLAASIIERRLREAGAGDGPREMMLTGGRSAARLYAEWVRTGSLPLHRLRLTFGDERAVPPDHAESNYGLVMRTLLAGGLPPGCRVARMEAERDDREGAARDYERALPPTIDVLLLGVGTDGHVASLFPGATALREEERRVVPARGPVWPHERLTITPSVIRRAAWIFVLATGAEKGAVLRRALDEPDDVGAMPVRLTLRGTWLLDAAAARELPAAITIHSD